MQNKANFRKSQMNVNTAIAMDYENISDWTLGENKPNTKPIKANTNPTCRGVASGEAGSNPILSRHSLGEGGFKGSACSFTEPNPNSCLNPPKS